MGVAKFQQVAEAATADACFKFVRALWASNSGLCHKVSYQIIDKSTLFPSDAAAAARAEDFVGVAPQPGDANATQVIGPRSPLVYALRVRSQRTGQTRLLFFGLRLT